MLPLLADAATAADPVAAIILAGSGDSAVAGLLFPFVAGPAVFALVYE